MGLVVSIIKNVQYVGTYVKCYSIYAYILLFYAYFFYDL